MSTPFLPPRIVALARRLIRTPTVLALSAILIGAPGCDPAMNNAAPEGIAASADGLEAPGAAPDAAPEIARDIEEADVVKIVGDKLYALNRYKGLLVVDVADPDAPALLGTLDLRGRGVEMYVIDHLVHVLLSADFYVAYVDAPVQPGLALPQPDFQGSQLAVVDVTDPTTPALKSKINLVGFANESRRVGDVIYVVGSNFGPYFAENPENAPGQGEGFVASINVSDPEDIVAVQRENITGDALNMHVSMSTIYAASRSYDFDHDQALTEVQVIDIADAAGAIVLRDVFTVHGSIRNRFYMDEFEGVFRIATESFGFGEQEVRVFTYDASDLDDVQPLGNKLIIKNESLEAVRFDGPRGYAVTFFNTDPLFVLDLSEPAAPKVDGELEVPGFSTHIEPRGDRLIAVGIDDTDGRRPAIAHYDVSDPADPTQLGRVVLGPPGAFTSSEATYDEKAFKIVDELGLIAMPFRHVQYGDPAPTPLLPAGQAIVADEFPTCMNGVQLVDFNETGLSQRGWFDHKGDVNRVGVIGERVFALSQMGLQTVDITDRDNPRKTGSAEFLSEEEMSRFNDCASFDIPIDPGIDGVGFSSLLELCGLLGAAPVLLLPICMFVLRRSFRR